MTHGTTLICSDPHCTPQDYPGAGEVALPRVTMFLYLTDTRNSAIRLLPGSHTVTTPRFAIYLTPLCIWVVSF